MSQNRKIEQVFEEAYHKVPELAILVEVLAEAHIQRLTASVRKVQEEMAKVQLELNL